MPLTPMASAATAAATRFFVKNFTGSSPLDSWTENVGRALSGFRVIVGVGFRNLSCSKSHFCRRQFTQRDILHVAHPASWACKGRLWVGRRVTSWQLVRIT